MIGLLFSVATLNVMRSGSKRKKVRSSVLGMKWSWKKRSQEKKIWQTKEYEEYYAEQEKELRQKFGDSWLTVNAIVNGRCCLLYTSPSPRDLSTSRMPSSA